MSEAEFNGLLSRNERLIRFRGQWIYLDPAFLDQIRKLMDSIDPAEGLSLQDIFQLHLLSELERDKVKSSWDGESPEELDYEEEARLQLEVELNAHLLGVGTAAWTAFRIRAHSSATRVRAELRGYQHQGFHLVSLPAEVRAWRLFGR